MGFSSPRLPLVGLTPPRHSADESLLPKEGGSSQNPEVWVARLLLPLQPLAPEVVFLFFFRRSDEWKKTRLKHFWLGFFFDAWKSRRQDFFGNENNGMSIMNYMWYKVQNTSIKRAEWVLEWSNKRLSISWIVMIPVTQICCETIYSKR